MPNSVNFSMVLANRAVILFKIKEFEWAILDINLSIETGRYPQENLHKLYQRLAKSYEHLQKFELAINCYKKFIESLKLSNLTKNQRLQLKNDTEKSMVFCKNGVMAKNLTAFKPNEEQNSNAKFPSYSRVHSQIKNASGKYINLLYNFECDIGFFMA